MNPQRNRQSQRCECRWRIVLFENLKTSWEFRKSQNAEAFIHNHALLRPDEIKKEWPREVSEKIFELARQRLPTNEIRQQVREQYPDISWDDRRFYNRLSEERQKMKQRDTALRTLRLVNLSAQICMVNSGSEDLCHYVESKLLALLQDTCKFANINSNSIHMPVPIPTTMDFEEKQKTEMKRENDKSPKKSFESLPKGYLAVPIPEHTFHVKMYSQNSAGDIRRAIFDMQRTPTTIVNNPHLQYVNQPRRRRSRALFAPEEDTDSMDLDTPPRKLSRQVASSIIDDELDDMSSQSSPSNSQALLFAAANQESMNYNRIDTNLFYANNTSNNTETSGYLNQPDNNVYPPSRPMQQAMYDPNAFVQPVISHERPHSMTFGAPIRSSIVRPTGYPANFTQLQNMIEENDNKSRYYTPIAQSSSRQENYLNQEHMFPSTSTFQPQNVFPTPFMTNDQLLQQQQKRKQQYYQQQLERQQLERQQLERQQLERQQQQDQHLYRRASGPG